MPRKLTGQNTFDAAIDRMVEIYQEGHRVVVSFSGGKDSGACVEICVIAAQLTGRLPAEVIMRDEEIMFPGTFEYAERMAERPDIDFNWIYACQPVLNCFNREQPYFWVFDPQLDPAEWVRRPPGNARLIPNKDITSMTIPDRFPPPPGKQLYAVIGLRTSESRGRMYGLFSSKGYVTKPNEYGVLNARPIYDWSDGDIWKAHKDNAWDYNEAYDVMARHGMTAPAWIADRAREAERIIISAHKHHSSAPLLEITPCYNCTGNVGSWKKLAFALFGGDPFAVASSGWLPVVEPEFFRAGAGLWGGKPAF